VGDADGDGTGDDEGSAEDDGERPRDPEADGDGDGDGEPSVDAWRVGWGDPVGIGEPPGSPADAIPDEETRSRPATTSAAPPRHLRPRRVGLRSGRENRWPAFGMLHLTHRQRRG
jgi:hypothetical protein